MNLRDIEFVQRTIVKYDIAVSVDNYPVKNQILIYYLTIYSFVTTFDFSLRK